MPSLNLLPNTLVTWSIVPLSQVAFTVVTPHLSAFILPSLTTASSQGVGEQYTYHGNEGVGRHYHPAGTAGHVSDLRIAPGLLRPEYYPPLASVYVSLSLCQYLYSSSDWTGSLRTCQMMATSATYPHVTWHPPTQDAWPRAFWNSSCGGPQATC
jgi:hypothetical protein